MDERKPVTLHLTDDEALSLSAMVGIVRHRVRAAKTPISDYLYWCTVKDATKDIQGWLRDEFGITGDEFSARYSDLESVIFGSHFSTGLQDVSE